MFFHIIKYEIRAELRKPANYIYFIVLFVFTIISFLGTGGYFDDPVETVEKVSLLNSPYEINSLLLYISKLFLFLLPAIVGNVIYIDFKHKIYPVLYTFPVYKMTYLSGKFVSAFITVMGISLGPLIALMLGEKMLGSSNPMIGDFSLPGYIQAYGFFVFPNLLIGAIIVFTIVALTRNIYSGFGTALFLILLQLIIENLFVGNQFWVAISDPFGQNAVAYQTSTWTLSEQNTEMIPIGEVILINRAIWFGIAVIFALVLLKSFSLSQFGLTWQFFQGVRKNKKTTLQKPVNEKKEVLAPTHLTWKQKVYVFNTLVKNDFLFLVSGPFFIVLTIAGISLVLIMLLRITHSSEMIMLPLTRILLSGPTFVFTIVVTIITFIDAGRLVHRSQTAGMDSLVNITPVKNSILLLSKIVTLFLEQLLLLFILLVSCIILQFALGYYKPDLSQYIFKLFVLTPIVLLAWAFVALFIHTIIRSLYPGLFLLILLWLFKDAFEQIGVNTYLLKFNSPPRLIYSDMNGYGHFLPGYFLVAAYWLSVSGLLIFVSYLFWNREKYFSLRERIHIAISRIKTLPILGMIILLISVLISGNIIYTEEKKDIQITTNTEILNNFKERFAPYEEFPQPRITSLILDIDLFPDQHSFEADGQYTLINKTNLPIDTLLIKTGFDEITDFVMNTPNIQISKDTIMKFYVYKLKQSMIPGDSLILDFTIKNTPNTLFDRYSNVLKNGTFMKHDILPRLGYFVNTEKRSPLDSIVINNHYQAIDSDLLSANITISTTQPQTAIATGKLTKQWNLNGRSYFRYQTESPVKLGFAFTSANYATEESYWKNIPLTVYYHSSHSHNIGQMLAGLKASLNYNNEFFGPFPRSEMKIVQFPLTEGSYATTMENAIYISEQRFGVNAGDINKTDLAFYVTAHEATHQWFGNKLMPKNALGAMILTESITEYITLKIYEQQFGIKRALQFLELQRNRYLDGHYRETKKEPPLFLVEPGQDYLAYGKGAMAFNTLSHYIGVNKLNETLRSLMENFPAKQAYYPTSVDLLESLQNAAPDSLHYLIKDMFMRVIFYDSKIQNASIQKNGLHFDVSVEFRVEKYEDGNKGSPEILNDLIKIGFYDKNDQLIEMRQIWVTQTENVITLQLQEQPTRITLDPNLLTIEKDVKDNNYLF